MTLVKLAKFQREMGIGKHVVVLGLYNGRIGMNQWLSVSARHVEASSEEVELLLLSVASL